MVSPVSVLVGLAAFMVGGSAFTLGFVSQEARYTGRTRFPLVLLVLLLWVSCGALGAALVVRDGTVELEASRTPVPCVDILPRVEMTTGASHVVMA